MKKILFLGLLLANIFLACGRLPKVGPGTVEKLATASEKDCGFVQNSYGQRVSWKRNFPIKIYIDPSIPTEYDSIVRSAASKWENVLGRTLFVFERATQVTTASRDSRNVMYWVNPWTENDKKLQAMTSLSWTNNQLMEADMKIDSQYYSFYLTEPSSTMDVHLESLLVHELGHVLGLKHYSDNSPSVMLPVLDYLLKREVPTEEDKANLKCEYN